jgi:hypothetical protein
MPQPPLPFVSIKEIIKNHQGDAPQGKTWWGPIWRGLVVESAGKHYRAMGKSIWLYVYLIIHADRRNGTLTRLLPTVARDMGVKLRTVRGWLSVLKTNGYVIAQPTGRALKFQIAKWKPLRGNTAYKK